LRQHRIGQQGARQQGGQRYGAQIRETHEYLCLSNQSC
jgi:hypothetical protein